MFSDRHSALLMNAGDGLEHDIGEGDWAGSGWGAPMSSLALDGDMGLIRPPTGC